MKRTLCILLTIISLMTLFTACSGSGETPAVQTNVAKPFTQAELDALPVANSNMTVDELRQLCVDFMRYQNSIPWTPSKQFDYKNGDKPNSWPEGSVVGGMPYITLGSGSLYNFMHFYDERNGMLDIEAIETMKQPMREIVTNQCSGSTYWAWARVSNSVTYEYTNQMFAEQGCIPIGGYYIDPAMKDFKIPVPIDTRDICKENGEQKMYQAYTAILPADGLVHFYGTSGGHVYMSSSKAVVVYKADGTIDGDKSYITILDQTFSKHTTTQENGVQIDTLGSVDAKRTFKKLYDNGYLPFTIPEFVGQDDVEKSEVSTTHTKDTVNYDELSIMKVKSNYPISYTTLTVKNSKGKVLYTQHLYTAALNIYEFKPFNTLVMDTTLLRKLANGKNKVEITAQIGTGELVTVFNGTFVPKSK